MMYALLSIEHVLSGTELIQPSRSAHLDLIAFLLAEEERLSLEERVWRYLRVGARSVVVVAVVVDIVVVAVAVAVTTVSLASGTWDGSTCFEVCHQITPVSGRASCILERHDKSVICLGSSSSGLHFCLRRAYFTFAYWRTMHGDNATHSYCCWKGMFRCGWPCYVCR